MGRKPERGYCALHVDVAADEAEAWGDALLDAGAMSVDGGDAAAGTAHETALFDEGAIHAIALLDEGAGGARAWWPVSSLVALFRPDEDPESAVTMAARALRRQAPSHHVVEVADRDWVAATRAQFAPLEVAKDLWIVPTWCEPVAPGAVNIRLDPGVAFGTGSHPTTQMCLAWLKRTVGSGDAVLDYGCGSGILAIAAAKLGAARVRGVDIDPQAVRASRDNARANGVRASFAPVRPVQPCRSARYPRSARGARYDIVIANILANPLRFLAPVLATRSADGGRIALAGILEVQAAEVIDAYAPWFTIRCEDSRDGWVLLVGTGDCRERSTAMARRHAR